jgi:hypothetical protein
MISGLQEYQHETTIYIHIHTYYIGKGGDNKPPVPEGPLKVYINRYNQVKITKLDETCKSHKL